MNYLSIVVNLKNLAFTQYQDFNFNSFASLENCVLGANENGLYEIGSADNDDETAIDAFAEFAISDFGVPNKKRLRKIYVGYEASGSVKVILTPDEGAAITYILSPILASQKQGSSRLEGQRSGKGRYWKIRVENVTGCDFALDSIDIIPVILGSK